MISDTPHTSFSNLSAEMLFEVFRVIMARVTSDVIVTILYSLFCTVTMTFSIGDDSGLLLGQLVMPPPPEAREQKVLS